MLLRDTAAKVTIVLIDNAGGTIFQMLPVATTAGAAFDRFFLTPTRLPADRLAGAWGIEESHVESLEQLRQQLPNSAGPQMLRIRTDGEGSHRLRRESKIRVIDALERQSD
jgi:2-succinyl-5-enolpyruvyl-6-hydroxy-3-cyclohexene-1-carboxylate synthase